MKARINLPAKEILTLPLLGKIKVGIIHEGNNYPSSLDHFRATGNYASMFTDAYGDKPTSIQIIFITDKAMEACKEFYEARDNKGKLVGYGDGETWYLWDAEKEDYIPTKSQSDVKKHHKKFPAKWKRSLKLNFVIPKVKGVFGYWQFETKADKSSIDQIIQCYDEFKERLGTTVNVPFDLNVKKVTSQKPGSKNSFPVVSLIPNISTANIEILRNYLNQGGDIKQLGKLDEAKIKTIGNVEKS